MLREVLFVANTNHRLTVTPTRVTIKLVPGRESEHERVKAFAEKVADEMLAKGVHQTWRGKIKFQGNRLKAEMYMGDNRHHWWHHKEK